MKITEAAIVIPSRLGSTRLAQKPLIKIGNLTMIEHVVNRALESDIEKVCVVTDSDLIADVLAPYQVEVIIVDDGCATGTDRVFAAVKKANLQHEVIIDLQGDMPMIDPSIITKVARLALESNYDIATAVAKKDIDYASSNSNVKVVIANSGKALYFSRALIPYNAQEFFCHVGIYGFKRASLEKFCSFPQSDLERQESLEQLRGMQNGMTIGTCIVDNMPVSVDTQDDLNCLIKSL